MPEKAKIKILEVTESARNSESGFTPTINVKASVDGVEEGFHEIPVQKAEFDRLREQKDDKAAKDFLFEEVESYAKSKQRADEIAAAGIGAPIDAAPKKGTVLKGFTGTRQAEDEDLDIQPPAKAPVTVETEVTGTPAGSAGAPRTGTPSNVAATSPTQGAAVPTKATSNAT